MGRINDRAKIVSWGPANNPFGESIVSNERRGVAFATWPVLDIEAFTHDASDGLEQFLYRCSVTGAKIESVTCPVVQQVLDCAGVCVGEIEHVNEIANTGSVARVVVRA